MPEKQFTSLEISIHEISGGVVQFTQSDPAQINTILEGVNSAHRFFTQPYFMIGGDAGLSVFRADQINRIEFLVDYVPDLPFVQGALSVQEIAADVFAQRFDAETYKKLRKIVWDKPGTIQVGFARIEMQHSAPLLWEIQMISKPLTSIDMGPFITSLLNAGGLWAKRDGQGFMIVNPANITRIIFMPGPPELPAKAWHAHRVGE